MPADAVFVTTDGGAIMGRYCRKHLIRVLKHYDWKINDQLDKVLRIEVRAKYKKVVPSELPQTE
jgi:hypothetical protein